MFKKLNLLLILLISILLLQCSKNPVTNEDKAQPRSNWYAKALVESDNSFGFKLFKEIIEAEQNKNVFISPLSVSMALGMTYNGANGSTQEAMQEVLELSGLTIPEVNESYENLIKLLTQLDAKVRFQIANSIWYRQGLTPEEEFLNLCKEYFSALVTGLDFSHPNAAKTINAWVDENTNGKIKEIVDDPIDAFIVMSLINAIYFKGDWTYQFDKDQTKDDWFTLPDGTKTRCKMMEQRGLYKYFANDDFQILDLPYGDGDFRMTILLPNFDKNIDSLIAEFDHESFNHWISCLAFPADSFDIYIPKFKLEYELKLNDVLEALGMGIAFSPVADFTKMYKGGGVWIDEVRHKTFVEVNEEGTEAAAVTSVSMVDSCPGHHGFRVDRSFVFVIRENQSQSILFIGKIVEPTFE